MTLYLYQEGTQRAEASVEPYGVRRTKEKWWKTLILEGKDPFSLFKVQSLTSCYFLGNGIRGFEGWSCQLLGDSGGERSGNGGWSSLAKAGLCTQQEGRISSLLSSQPESTETTEGRLFFFSFSLRIILYFSPFNSFATNRSPFSQGEDEYFIVSFQCFFIIIVNEREWE